MLKHNAARHSGHNKEIDSPPSDPSFTELVFTAAIDAGSIASAYEQVPKRVIAPFELASAASKRKVDLARTELEQRLFISGILLKMRRGSGSAILICTSPMSQACNCLQLHGTYCAGCLAHYGHWQHQPRQRRHSQAPPPSNQFYAVSQQPQLYTPQHYSGYPAHAGGPSSIIPQALVPAVPPIPAQYAQSRGVVYPQQHHVGSHPHPGTASRDAHYQWPATAAPSPATQYPYGDAVAVPSSSRSRHQPPQTDQETPGRGRSSGRNREPHTHDHRRASSMHASRSSSAPACPACGRIDPTEWRFGIISQVYVCNACSKSEKRNRELRSQQTEQERERRMAAGARR
ncbi:hypothetical protein HMN09_01117100 [Mycena chlorophos]|uniref:GATA-type domain-containing protein n=1 Tax=Mycena chlorophos TaxID=658473 RepID=A0A8H6SB87_MYCCL|nr:hypothetical protein HMN09_01117100 [Mycena chlorophos]